MIENEKIPPKNQKDFEDYVQNGCGFEAGYLLIKACGGDAAKALEIVEAFPSDEKLTAFYRGLDVCLRTERDHPPE